MEPSKEQKGKLTQILDTDPARRKHLTDTLMAFLADKVSIAELKGISRDNLYRIADSGYIKFKHGRIEEAFKIYQALILLDHRNAYFHTVMGAIHQKMEHPVEAIMEYTQAIRLNRNDPSSYVNRGELYLRHKNYKKAAEDFRVVIIMDMEGKNLWANRARSLVIAIKRSMEADRARKGRRITVR